jgi:hypothetical protein
MAAGTQTVAGAKTFSTALTINPTTNQIVLGTTNTTTINSTAPAASRTYNIIDAGGAADFVMTAATQTIGGAKTFSSAVTINPASNQLVLASGVNALTLNSGTSAAARTYTVPDVGATGTFALLQGAQTFSALKTFSAGVAITGGTAATQVLSVAGTTWTVGNGPTITEAGAATFATSVTSPLIVGGSSVSQVLTIKSTTGIGTSDRIDFTVGNNGAVTGLSIGTTGQVTAGILTGSAITHSLQGGATNSALSDVLRMTQLGTGPALTGLLFSGRNTSAAVADYVRIASLIEDSTAGTHSGGLKFYTALSGTLAEKGSVTSAGAWAQGPNAGSAGSINHLARGSQRLSTLQYAITSGGTVTETTPATLGTSQTVITDVFTDMAAATARNIANGLSVFVSGIYTFFLTNVDGDVGTFQVAVGFENGVTYRFALVGGTGNCTVTGTSTLTITALGDGRTYTLTFNAVLNTATLASSSLATGTTTLRTHCLRAF